MISRQGKDSKDLLGLFEDKVREMAKKIHPQMNDFPLFGTIADLGHPFIEVDQKGYHFVVQEKGHEIRRVTTNEVDELLYLVFEDISRTMAIRFARTNNVPGKDFRRVYFSKQQELLSVVNPQWKKRIENIHNAILIKEPFDDFANERAILCGELRNQGYSDEKAWELSCQKFPLPQGNENE